MHAWLPGLAGRRRCHRGRTRRGVRRRNRRLVSLAIAGRPPEQEPEHDRVGRGRPRRGRRTGMSPAMTGEGSTTAMVFASDLRRGLVPALHRGRVVVDNVGADKPERMRELVAAAGCELTFLPVYSPELFPWRRPSRHRVPAAGHAPRAALESAFTAARNAVTPVWFT